MDSSTPLPEDFHADDKFEPLYGRSPFEGMLNWMAKNKLGRPHTPDDFRWLAGLPERPQEPES